MTERITTAQGFPPREHDHRMCVATALTTAEDLCRQRGARLTAQRRRVLELVWASHTPIGAYDLLARLSESKDSKVAPPTVYRALDFLLVHGLVHRIESLNAYIGCACPETSHTGHFLICRRCHMAAEVQDPSLADALRACATRYGFAPEQETVELRGLCPACRAAPETAFPQQNQTMDPHAR